jgi:UDP-N-acetylmuramate dehydrogenase
LSEHWFDMKSTLESLVETDVQRNINLSLHTSFGIGGPASMFVKASSTDALKSILAAASKLHLNTLILGGGTNLLVSDDGFDGLVIQLDLNRVTVDQEKGRVHVGASTQTSELVEQLVEAGLGGLEFAAGLPGTIGGAIAGNAGCFGHTLSDFLVHATVVEPNGDIIQVADMDWFRFRYRHSKLPSTGTVLAEAAFTITPGNANDQQQACAKYLAVRAEKHPRKGIRTAGSYFRNLPSDSGGDTHHAAGALLDQVGARDLSVGDAAVFERHANIIVNKGRATAKDVLALAKEMKHRVHERFGVTLVEEVRFIGARPEGL